MGYLDPETRPQQDRLPGKHAYAKEEAQALFTECKETITDIIKEAMGTYGPDSHNAYGSGDSYDSCNFYKKLADIVLSCDDESVTRWFNTYIDHMATRAKVCAYDDARMKLETIYKNAAQDRHTQEICMQKIERALGAFIKKEFMELDILYGHPDEASKKPVAGRKWDFRLQGTLLVFAVGVLAVAVGCIFFLAGKL